VDVLIIDDDSGLRESIADLIRGEFDDLEIAVAKGLDDALGMLASAAPSLVVAELREPGDDPSEVVSKVRELRPAVAFIFVSESVQPEGSEAHSALRVQFVAKPLVLAELARAVDSALTPAEFVGQVGGISLADLLHVLHFGKRTVAIHVRRRGRDGWIYLEQGEVVHSVLGDASGVDAFRQILAWRDGQFGTEPRRTSAARTIDEPFNSILLNAFRILDEDSPMRNRGDTAPANGAAPESSSDRPQAAEGVPLDGGLRAIPGAATLACVELGEQARLLGLVPEGALPSEMKGRLPCAVAELFASSALQKLDAALAPAGEWSGKDFPQIREVIALSAGTIHFLLRSKVTPERISAVTAPASANLGTVVARARAWLGSLESRRPSS